MKRRPIRSLLMLSLLACAFAGHAETFAPGWGTLVYPPGARAVAEMKRIASIPDGSALHLLARDASGTAGANSATIPGLTGRIRFEYRADRVSSTGDNLTLHVIPLGESGAESNGAGRTTFVLPKRFAGDGKFHVGTLDFNYAGTKGIHLILAPRVNEGGGKGPGEAWFGNFRIEPLPSRLEVVRFGPERSLVKPGQSVIVGAIMKNAGGSIARLDRLRLRADGVKIVSMSASPVGLSAMQVASLRWRVAPRRSGAFRLELRDESAKSAALASAPLAVANREAAAIASGASTLRWRMTGDEKSREHRIVAASFGADDAALLFPLASVVLEGGETFDLEPSAAKKTKDAVALVQRFHAKDGASFVLSASYRANGAEGWIADYRLQAVSRDLRIARFAGPTLRIRGKRAYAHFPGLEYLVGDDASSENAGDPEAMRLRFLPHPYKVTQPWMTVGVAGTAYGMAWDPSFLGLSASSDAKRDRGPQPLFAAPDFLQGGDDSLMALSLPSVGSGLKENAFNLLADSPMRLRKGESLRIRARLFAKSATSAADAAAIGWKLSPPPVVNITKEDRAKAIRLALKSYARQLWVPSANGWRMHLPLSFAELSRPAPSATVARDIFLAAKSLPKDDPIRIEAEAQARTVIENDCAGDGPLGVDVLEASAALGISTEPLLPRAKRGLAGILNSQEADGSWRFHPDEAHRALGEDGGAATGLIAGNASELLRYALLSGDPVAKSAGLKAARFMETLPRPEGSQVWEVPLHVPDILAAGRAAQTYLDAYRLTRDKRWLRRAVEAGKSGLTFVYSWGAPNRPVMRYGTIPVYGTSWHALAWYGLIVQWNGLDYAARIAPLSEYDSSLPWREIGEGIAACGLQLQRKENQTMYGCYPDVWSALTGAEPFAVPYINPSLILEALDATRNAS